MEAESCLVPSPSRPAGAVGCGRLQVEDMLKGTFARGLLELQASWWRSGACRPLTPLLGPGQTAGKGLQKLELG